MSPRTLLTVICLSAVLAAPSALAQYETDECEDAQSNAQSAASDLADYSRRLQRCADYEDSSDDCYTEFRRVKTAHEEYEYAVSEVSTYCD